MNLLDIHEELQSKYLFIAKIDGIEPSALTSALEESEMEAAFYIENNYVHIAISDPLCGQYYYQMLKDNFANIGDYEISNEYLESLNEYDS